MNKIIILASVIVLVFSACGEKTTTITTDSGIKVKFLTKGKGGALKDSSILLFNMRYINDKGNEMFDTDKRGGPVAMQYMDSVWKESGLIYEAFSECKVGDSISFEIPAEDLFVNTFKMSVPDTIDAKSNIKFFVSLENAFTSEGYQTYQKEKYEEEMAQKNKDIEAQVGIDLDIIKKHLADNNIDAITTESGISYVITKQGKGENAKAGQKVITHYHGTLLDGTKFDASRDRGKTFDFVLGQGRVIKGWDEGFALLNKGAEATLYIPSNLAYGAQDRSAIIKANSILIFDVELVDIK